MWKWKRESNFYHSTPQKLRCHPWASLGGVEMELYAGRRADNHLRRGEKPISPRARQLSLPHPHRNMMLSSLQRLKDRRSRLGYPRHSWKWPEPQENRWVNVSLPSTDWDLKLSSVRTVTSRVLHLDRRLELSLDKLTKLCGVGGRGGHKTDVTAPQANDPIRLPYRDTDSQHPFLIHTGESN